jgi:hypothetical protein
MNTITRTVGGLRIFALALLFAVASTVANAETRIGTARSVKPGASGSIAGALSAGSGVLANETIKTGSSGQAGLQFNDQSNLTVGPSSQVRLDKFVHDPNKGTGDVAIEASRGAFRFVYRLAKSRLSYNQDAFWHHGHSRLRCDRFVLPLNR